MSPIISQTSDNGSEVSQIGLINFVWISELSLNGLGIRVVHGPNQIGSDSYESNPNS